MLASRWQARITNGLSLTCWACSEAFWFSWPFPPHCRVISLFENVASPSDSLTTPLPSYPRPPAPQPAKAGRPCSSNSKESACDAGDHSSIHGSGRSSGERNGNPLQYSCLENSIDRSLAGYSSWCHRESDMTELLTHTASQSS